MKVSLIMPTINVTTELDLFLKSLKAQTYKNFELLGRTSPNNNIHI